MDSDHFECPVNWDWLQVGSQLPLQTRLLTSLVLMAIGSSLHLDDWDDTHYAVGQLEMCLKQLQKYKNLDYICQYTVS